MPTFILLLFLAISIVNVSIADDLNNYTDEQIQAAINKSKDTRGTVTWWRSPISSVRFGYDERWIQTAPIEEATEISVSWKTQKSGGLMAVCYLQSFTGSEVSKLNPKQIVAKAKGIVDSIMRNARHRDPNMKLDTWRLTKQDNHPVVYVERTGSVEVIDRTIHMKLYTIATAWKGREILFECGSSIPAEEPKIAGIVEGPIMKVLRTLLFVRM